MQIDLRGDISGFLSSHPKSPLISLHHLDGVQPIFPAMDSFKSARHVMKAAKADQSRMMQQTICYDRPRNWTFSISWGYSAHLYESMLPRSFLQNPIETFKPWTGVSRDPPHYMFNTRLPSKDPSENPGVFFFKKVIKSSTGILSTYTRKPSSSSTSTDVISEIQVYSPATKRIQVRIGNSGLLFHITRSSIIFGYLYIHVYLNLLCCRWIDVNAVMLLVLVEAGHNSISGNAC